MSHAWIYVFYNEDVRKYGYLVSRNIYKVNIFNAYAYMYVCMVRHNLHRTVQNKKNNFDEIATRTHLIIKCLLIKVIAEQNILFTFRTLKTTVINVRINTIYSLEKTAIQTISNFFCCSSNTSKAIVCMLKCICIYLPALCLYLLLQKLQLLHKFALSHAPDNL